MARKSRPLRKPAAAPVVSPVSPGAPLDSPDVLPEKEVVPPQHEIEEAESSAEEHKEEPKHKVKKAKKDKKPKKEKKQKKDKKHKKKNKQEKKPGHFRVIPQSLQLHGRPNDAETQNTIAGGGAIPENYLGAAELHSRSGLVEQFVRDPNAVLEAINVHKKYPGTLCGPGKATAVKDFCISINEGDLVCIVGRNGSGKTTMTKLLIGEEMPSKGMILYRKKPLWKSDIFDNLGSSLEFGLWKYVDVEQHLNLYAALKGVEASAIRQCVSIFLYFVTVYSIHI